MSEHMYERERHMRIQAESLLEQCQQRYERESAELREQLSHYQSSLSEHKLGRKVAQSQLADTLDRIGVGVVIEDQHRRIASVNAAAVDFFGLHVLAQSLVGKDCSMFWQSLDDQLQEPGVLSEAWSECRGEVLRVRTKQGRYLNCEQSIASGKGRIWVIQDLSTTYRLKNELSKYRASQYQKDPGLPDMFSAVFGEFEVTVNRIYKEASALPSLEGIDDDSIAHDELQKLIGHISDLHRWIHRLTDSMSENEDREDAGVQTYRDLESASTG